MSKYFKKEEFACNCGCGFDDVDPKLIELMDYIREKAGEPLYITSGCRCPYWNEHERGEPNSQHLYGTACDFWAENTSVESLYTYAEEGNADGVGLYPTWVHADVRSGRTGDTYRW